VTDVGSVKQPVVDEARAILGTAMSQFVPGHPIAGTERSGVDSAFAELFDGHRVILTPVAETSAGALDRVRAMWEVTGATAEILDPVTHDRILAATSHLPHALAYALVDCLSGSPDSEDFFRFAAGGFRDFSRIASSDPAMWRDILLANRDAVLNAIDRYLDSLNETRTALLSSDDEALLKQFSNAKLARDGFAKRFAAVAERS